MEQMQQIQPVNNCPICLDTFKNMSFIDPCMHTFCYNCIRTWVNQRMICPLCMRKVEIILHNIRDWNDYDVTLIGTIDQSPGRGSHLFRPLRQPYNTVELIPSDSDDSTIEGRDFFVAETPANNLFHGHDQDVVIVEPNNSIVVSRHNRLDNSGATTSTGGGSDVLSALATPSTSRIENHTESEDIDHISISSTESPPLSPSIVITTDQDSNRPNTADVQDPPQHQHRYNLRRRPGTATDTSLKKKYKRF